MIIVETNRLILRQFQIPDAAALNSVFGDAEVMRFGGGIQSPEWVECWLQNCIEHWYPTWGFGPYAVVEKQRHEMIGYCGLFYFPNINGQPEVEIGYRLARAYWGYGYATEAAMSVRDYGFTMLGLTRLIAMIDPSNVASIRVAEKIGMRREGEVMFEGYTHPDYVYSV